MTKQEQQLIDAFMGNNKSIVMTSYDIDWNALMPVVEKIEGMLPCDSVITIAYKDCIIPVNEGEFDIQVIGADSKKAAVYEAVVEFIKWFNDNKEK